MATYAYDFNGSNPLIIPYKVQATVIQGQFTIVGTTSGSITDATTTSAADGAGVTASAATYSTTQGDTEGVAEVHASPMAVFRAQLTQGATNNTDLTTYSEDSGETAGTVLTDSDLPTASMDQGTVWRAGGGESRIITSVSSGASVTVTVPFSQDIGSGEEFHVIPLSPIQSVTAQLSTTLDQIDASIAAGTGAELITVGLELNGASDSYALVAHADHAFNKA